MSWYQEGNPNGTGTIVTHSDGFRDISTSRSLSLCDLLSSRRSAERPVCSELLYNMDLFVFISIWIYHS